MDAWEAQSALSTGSPPMHEHTFTSHARALDEPPVRWYPKEQALHSFLPSTSHSAPVSGAPPLHSHALATHRFSLRFHNVSGTGNMQTRNAQTVRGKL